MKKWTPVCFSLALLCSFPPHTVQAQEEEKDVSVEDQLLLLEKRVSKLEAFSSKIGPAMADFSEKMREDVNKQINLLSNRVVELNPISRKVNQIVANTGMFLISIQSMSRIEGGYRFTLQIGNPYSATFTGAEITMRWGKKWNPNQQRMTYKQWHDSLIRAVFSYPGELTGESWTEVNVDIVPALRDQIEYVECEMNLNSIKLQRDAGMGGE